MFRRTYTWLGVLAAISACFSTVNTGAQSNQVRNIVLVHGAWVDGSGWRPVDLTGYGMAAIVGLSEGRVATWVAEVSSDQNPSTSLTSTPRCKL
jgi:hypothetical protein